MIDTEQTWVDPYSGTSYARITRYGPTGHRKLMALRRNLAELRIYAASHDLPEARPDGHTAALGDMP